MIGSELLNFRILDQLGEGGMGVVYKGVDTTLDRLVAIKVLSSDLSRNPDLVERFRTEARAQANLNHTNIATLYAFVAQAGQAWMVMEYIEGETITQMLERRGLLPPDVAVPLFKQALLGIGWAHRMGIVHRDVKPSNLMVNKQGIVKVMDFGIAKVLGSSRGLTRTGTALGTAYYMSPEQVMNQAIDIRSDIYSLGVTLYEMLTANLPFQGESDFQIMTAHVHAPPPSPTRHYPYIPRGIENAVMKSMMKDPAARFQTVEEFGAALEHPDDYGVTWGVSTPGLVPPGPPPPPPPPSTPIPMPHQAGLTARPFAPPPGSQPPFSTTAPTAAITSPAQGRPTPSSGTHMPATNIGTPVPGPIPPGLMPPGPSGVITPPPLPPPLPPVQPSGGMAAKLIAGAAVLVLAAGVVIYQVKKRSDRHPDIPSSGGGTAVHNDKKETGEVTVWPPKPSNDTAAALKIVEFDADAKRVQPGQTARLRWSVQGASHITVTPDIGDVDSTGSKDVVVQRTTRFELKATKLSGEEVHQTVTVEVGTVTPPPPPPARRLEVAFDAQPDSVVLGQAARLRWAVPGADQVTITPTVGRVPATGSTVVKPTESTTYRLEAQGKNVTGSGEVTVQVQQPQKPPPPQPPQVPTKPEISFQATPPSVPLGSPATLTWSLQNAVAAAITPQPGTLRQTSGRVTVTPAVTTTYTLTARSKEGVTETATVTVQVTPPAGPPPPPPGPPARTATAVITVMHDHAGAMNAASWASCYGALQVINGTMRYAVTGSTDGRTDAFEVPVAQVQEVKLNRMRIRNQPAFHIAINGRHLNFVATGMAANQAVAELEATLPKR